MTRLRALIGLGIIPPGKVFWPKFKPFDFGAVIPMQHPVNYWIQRKMVKDRAVGMPDALGTDGSLLPPAATIMMSWRLLNERGDEETQAKKKAEAVEKHMKWWKKHHASGEKEQ
jgi:hypothetical protein